MLSLYDLNQMIYNNDYIGIIRNGFTFPSIESIYRAETHYWSFGTGPPIWAGIIKRSILNIKLLKQYLSNVYLYTTTHTHTAWFSRRSGDCSHFRPVRTSKPALFYPSLSDQAIPVSNDETLVR